MPASLIARNGAEQNGEVLGGLPFAAAGAQAARFDQTAQLGTFTSQVALIVNAIAFPGIVIGSAVVAVWGTKPVWITCTIDLTNTSGAMRDYTFRVLRNGIEIVAADRWVNGVGTGDRNSWSVTWVDTPGVAGVYTYQVEAISTNANVNQVANNRRIVALAT
jgi:hypothetical protein